MQLDVHALEGLLHQLHAGGGGRHVIGAQAQVVLQPADVSRWHEAGMQQTMHVQRGPPLAVSHVGLPARQVARLPAIDHAHFETGTFQYTVQRQPVHAGRFHRNGTYALCQQPVAQRV